MILSKAALNGVDEILRNCGRLKAGEKVAIVCDPTTRYIADAMTTRARELQAQVALIEVPELAYHGADPADEAAEAMKRADLAIGLTAKSMAHSQARRNACAAGARYLSLPDYNPDVLADSSLRADYETQAKIAAKITDLFTRGQIAHVTSAAGTDITMKLDGRIGNCCPGFVQGPGELGSPPDIESNISPLETESNGIVVVDGSIPWPGIGRLDAPVTLTVKDGAITKFEGEPALVRQLEELFAGIDSPKAYILAECGVGLNPLAKLCGNMLIDEGAGGTMHFGFGSNFSVGGMNKVPFHLDFIFENPSLSVDGTQVLKEGVVVL